MLGDKSAIKLNDTAFNEEYFEDNEYYKYIAEWISLSYEEQCEVPLLSFDEWKKEKLMR